ncbi:MAG: hypothetical protein AAGA27_05795 [Pseudomonadota bacterium]
MYAVNKNSNIIIATLLACLAGAPAFAVENNDERERFYGNVSISRVIHHSDNYDVFIADHNDQQRKSIGQFQSASDKAFTFSSPVDELPDTFHVKLCPQDGQLTDCIYSDSIQNPQKNFSTSVFVTLQSTINYHRSQNRPEQVVSFIDRVRQQGIKTNINTNHDDIEMQGVSAQDVMLMSDDVKNPLLDLRQALIASLLNRAVGSIISSTCAGLPIPEKACNFLGVGGGNNGFNFAGEIQNRLNEIKDKLILIDQKSDHIALLLQSMYASDIIKEFNAAEAIINNSYAQYMGQLNQTFDEQGLTHEQVDQYMPQARELEVIYEALNNFLVSMAKLFDHEGQTAKPYIPNPLKIGVYYQVIADRYYSGDPAVGGSGYEFSFRWTDPHGKEDYYMVTPHLAMLFQDYTIRTLVALTKWYTIIQKALASHSYYSADETVPANDPAKVAAADAAYFIFELLNIEPCTDMEVCTEAVNEIFDHKVEVLREVYAQYAGWISAYTLRDANTHSISAIVLKVPSKLLSREQINSNTINNIDNSLADVSTLRNHLPESDDESLEITRNLVMLEYDRMMLAGIKPKHIDNKRIEQLYKVFSPTSTELQEVQLSNVMQQTGGLIFSGVAGPKPLADGVGQIYSKNGFWHNNPNQDHDGNATVDDSVFFNQDSDQMLYGFWTYTKNNTSFYDIEENLKHVVWSGDVFTTVSFYNGLTGGHTWDRSRGVICNSTGCPATITLTANNINLEQFPVDLPIYALASNGGCVFDFGSYNNQKRGATNCMADVRMPTLIMYDNIDDELFKSILFDEIVQPITITLDDYAPGLWLIDEMAPDLYKATVHRPGGISIDDVQLTESSHYYRDIVTFDKIQQNETTVVIKPRLLVTYIPYIENGPLVRLTIAASHEEDGGAQTETVDYFVPPVGVW